MFNGVSLGSTRVVWKDLNPVWDERRQLPPLRTGAQNQLILAVYDKDDGVARGDFLGQVSVDLEDPANIGTAQTCELAPMAKEDAKFNKFVGGTLTFSVEYDEVCAARALPPLPLIFSYKSEKSLWRSRCAPCTWRCRRPSCATRAM